MTISAVSSNVTATVGAYPWLTGGKEDRSRGFARSRKVDRWTCHLHELHGV